MAFFKRRHFSGYTGASEISDFPVYLELNDSLSGFSYEQFASPFGYDLRFVSNTTNEEIEYEIVKWDPAGQSSFWLKLPELNGSTSIKALWGNQNALVQPGYSKDGRIWSKFRGVWHMDGTADDLVKESSSSFHAIPYNFETLRAPGVIGTALSFDGVNDYLDMPLDSHPPADARQVTFSFWSYGGTRHLNNNSILESGSSLGRHLNIHLPWSNARVYWDAGVGGIDRIEKDDPVYSGRWTYWAFQKDRDTGAMYIYRDGVLWQSGFSRTRPFGAPVDSFRIGSARYGGNHWHGLLDELRISPSIESPDWILASFLSQTPGTNFAQMQAVQGPPTILDGQVIEGYANDPARQVSYQVRTFPSADSFYAVGLPAGMDLNQTTGVISGQPVQGGNYQVTITAQNSFDSDQSVLQLAIVELSGFTHQTTLDFSGYTGSTLHDFPVLIRLDSNISNFSLKSFKSPMANDLRFFDNLGRELSYEIDLVDHSKGSLAVWVEIPEMSSTTTVSVNWGKASLADKPPVYADDGSAWSNGYRGVWHFRPMNEVGVLTDSSYYRNHALDDFGFTQPASVIGSGRSLSGGSEKFIRLPSPHSLDSLHEESYSFSAWVRLEEQPESVAPDSVFGIGYLMTPNDSYFDDIETLIALEPQAAGARIMQAGPRQGLYLNGDNDFKNAGIGINRNDNYMTLFLTMFTPAESGLHQFRCTDKDDRATIWLDLDQDGLFELSGDQGTEKMGGNNNFTSDPIYLDANQSYKMAIAHGEWGGGSRLRPWFLTPSYDWRVIDPSDPGQSGFFKVPFTSDISSRLSPFILYQHGANEKAFVGGAQFGATHYLTGQYVTASSGQGLPYSQWKHLFVNADHQNGSVQVFLDGNLSATPEFCPPVRRRCRFRGRIGSWDREPFPPA